MTRLLAALVLLLATPALATADCRPEPVTPETPTGIAGCVVYGVGTASTWPGPGVARNDCVWPWDECQAIAITSLETGVTIIVTPQMFCDCWTGHDGPNGETARIVDLDPTSVAALGLDPSRGLWPVEVQPFREGDLGHMQPVLPDTAVAP